MSSNLTPYAKHLLEKRKNSSYSSTERASFPKKGVVSSGERKISSMRGISSRVKSVATVDSPRFNSYKASTPTLIERLNSKKLPVINTTKNIKKTSPLFRYNDSASMSPSKDSRGGWTSSSRKVGHPQLKRTNNNASRYSSSGFERKLALNRSPPGTPHSQNSLRSPSSGRRRNIALKSDDPLRKAQIGKPKYIPKSAETRAAIRHALKGHYLFSTLGNRELEHVIDAMSRETLNEGDDVITEGEPGAKFYVVEVGACEVLQGPTGDQHIVGTIESGGSFGELALLYDNPRAATITASAKCILWVVDRNTFRQILATTAASSIQVKCQFLQNMEMFKLLNKVQIAKIAGALSEMDAKDGEYIIRQGDKGDRFYIINEGVVKCTKSNEKEEDEDESFLMNLSVGDYFGEMALLLNQPRQANVIAVGDVQCFTLKRKQFDVMLGSLRELLDHQMNLRIVKSVPMFKKLSERKLDIIVKHLKRVSYKKGTYIIKQGEPGTEFYILKEGLLKVTMSNGRKQVELARLKINKHFGEMALINDKKRNANVIAITDVKCLCLSRNMFRRLISMDGNINDIVRGEMEHREKMLGEISKGIIHTLKKSDTTTAPSHSSSPTLKTKLKDLKQLATLGTGTFGRVKMVTMADRPQVMALKCMQKAHIVKSHQQKNVLNEKVLMAECRHPFILRLISTMQDRNCIYMLLELVQGGELWSLLYEKMEVVGRTDIGGFPEYACQFYAGCVTSALHYLHDKNIAYRDLKPENLLLDSQGYIKVVDFGFAKRIPYISKDGTTKTKSFTLCGTPEYLSPELVLNYGHTQAADYWALGILIYELITGGTPFADPSQSKIFEKIIKSKKYLRFPRHVNPDARELVERLLHPNPALRLGNLKGGVNDIRSCRWFRNFDWDALENKKLEAPFLPMIRDDYDTSNFDSYDENESIESYIDDGRGWFDDF